MSEFYKRDGTKYEGENALMDWAKDFKDSDKKIVKQEVLENDKYVSTVWLGLDHSFEEGKPIIFETMVFSQKRGENLDEERYSTEEEAIEGHKKMVTKWSKIK